MGKRIPDRMWYSGEERAGILTLAQSSRKSWRAGGEGRGKVNGSATAYSSRVMVGHSLERLLATLASRSPAPRTHTRTPTVKKEPSHLPPRFKHATV